MSSDPFANQPLLSFSLYTYTQADTLRRVGQEINEITATWEDRIEGFQRAYDLFWLWVLGTYEVIRTMEVFSSSFSENLKDDTKNLKLYLAKIRMPFAKQQLRGKNTVVYGELSVTSVKHGLCFKIDNESFNSTEVINRFIAFLDALTFADLGVIPITVSNPPPRG